MNKIKMIVLSEYDPATGELNKEAVEIESRVYGDPQSTDEVLVAHQASVETLAAALDMASRATEQFQDKVFEEVEDTSFNGQMNIVNGWVANLNSSMHVKVPYEVLDALEICTQVMQAGDEVLDRTPEEDQIDMVEEFQDCPVGSIEELFAAMNAQLASDRSQAGE